jgi:hypothetical protein
MAIGLLLNIVSETPSIARTEQFGPIPHDRPFGPLGKIGSTLAANSADCAVFADYTDS